MTYYRCILATLIFCQTACILGMVPQQSLPQYTEQDIVKMIVTREPLPAWIPWLIERNNIKPIQWYAIANDRNPGTAFSKLLKTAALSSKLVFKGKKSEQNSNARLLRSPIEDVPIEVDLTGSFDNLRTTKQLNFEYSGNGTIIVSLDHQKSLAIDPCSESFIDMAISRDGARLVGISNHCVMIWNIQQGQGSLLDKITFNDRTLARLVNISANNRSIVLQDSMLKIFAFNLIERNAHLIYENDNASAIHAIACDDHYCFLEMGPSYWREQWNIDLIYITDIAELFPSLNFDQIRLLSWIHKAATTGHLLNLKGRSRGIIHARSAFSSLPERIKALVQEFVELPQLLDLCIIC